MTTLTYSEAAEKLLDSRKGGFNVGKRSGKYTASCHWPNNDVLRDAFCFGEGDTLDAAIEKMDAKIEDAKARGKMLRTASECKEAVISLIREHDAAPASFRDAVDALPVAK